MKSWLHIICILALHCNLRAQDHAMDSLRKVLQTASNDTTRCTILSAMIESETSDELWPKYNEEVRAIAEKNLTGNLSPAEKRFFQNTMADVLNNAGYAFQIKGNIPAALENFQASLKKYREVGNKKGIAYELNTIGLIYKDHNQLAAARDCFIESLQLNEEAGSVDGIASSTNNLGIIFQAMSDFPNAMNYYKRTLELHSKTGNKDRIATTLNNIGFLYYRQDESKKAMTYFQKSLVIWKELENAWGIGFELNMIGHLYCREKEWEKALEYGEHAFAISKTTHRPDDIRNASEVLWQAYNALGKPDKALEMFELNVKMRDSINSLEAEKASIKSQLMFEYEKKAARDSIKAIEEKKVTAAQFKAEQTQQYVLYGGLLLAGLFAALMVNRFRIITAQKKLIEVRKKEAEAQKKTAEQQKAIVDEKQKEILDSIHYARRIQHALITSENYIHKTLTALQRN